MNLFELVFKIKIRPVYYKYGGTVPFRGNRISDLHLSEVKLSMCLIITPRGSILGTVGFFSPPQRPYQFWAHPPTLLSSGSFTRGGALRLTTYLFLMPNLSICGAVSPPPIHLYGVIGLASGQCYFYFKYGYAMSTNLGVKRPVCV